MPVVLHQLLPANAGQPGYNEAKELALQTVAQFGAVRGVGVGVAGGSCCAAVAVTPSAFYPAGPGVAFGTIYGNSQIAAGGLALGPLGGHAERCALTAAGGTPLYLLPGTNDAVLFVELSPCAGCGNWLNGGGGGVPNPYNGTINGAGVVTLHVWYRWAYPGGVANMNAFHGLTVALQTADINANW